MAKVDGGGAAAENEGELSEPGETEGAAAKDGNSVNPDPPPAPAARRASVLDVNAVSQFNVNLSLQRKLRNIEPKKAESTPGTAATTHDAYKKKLDLAKAKQDLARMQRETRDIHAADEAGDELGEWGKFSMSRASGRDNFNMKGSKGRARRSLASFNDLLGFLEDEDLEDFNPPSDDDSDDDEFVSSFRLDKLNRLGPKIRSSREWETVNNAYGVDISPAHKSKGRGGRNSTALVAREMNTNASLNYLTDNCVINASKLRRYKHIFHKCTKEKPDIALTPEELIYALKRVNKWCISKAEIKFIFYVLDLLGEDASGYHDFKAFAAIAALSERVAPMEHLIKGFVDGADFDSLRKKLDRANDMFLNLFKESEERDNYGAIDLDELEYVFRAGGLSNDEVEDILQALRENEMDPLTYLDYLAYIPMFIDIHAKIIENPFA